MDIFGGGLVDNILTIDELGALEPLSDYGNATSLKVARNEGMVSITPIDSI